MRKILGIFVALMLAALLPASAFSQDAAQTARALESEQKNTTNLHYDDYFGTQVEYLSSRNKAYLWFPGNSVIVPGEWMILVSTSNPSAPPLMCFKYPTNSYNPATGERGGNWECRPLPEYLGTLKEQVSGDLFHLARSQHVPFVLSKEPATLQQLKDSM
ncbi:MAG: hypothetical protein H6873_02295 [Hyphomicrobiaceae bacterium]|nr:hypothetical protein [Hyphomicrobiaceae bacterium]